MELYRAGRSQTRRSTRCLFLSEDSPWCGAAGYEWPATLQAPTLTDLHLTPEVIDLLLVVLLFCFNLRGLFHDTRSAACCEEGIRSSFLSLFLATHARLTGPVIHSLRCTLRRTLPSSWRYRAGSRFSSHALYTAITRIVARCLERSIERSLTNYF